MFDRSSPRRTVLERPRGYLVLVQEGAELEGRLPLVHARPVRHRRALIGLCMDIGQDTRSAAGHIGTLPNKMIKESARRTHIGARRIFHISGHGDLWVINHLEHQVCSGAGQREPELQHLGQRHAQYLKPYT